MASIKGTTGDDTLFGTAAADTMNGLNGNDWLEADAGNDLVNGGAGDDVLLGGRGLDTLNGGVGADNISCHVLGDTADGRDRATGGAGDDFISGGAGDILDGGDGLDSFYLYLDALGGDLNLDFSGFAESGSLRVAGGKVTGMEAGWIICGTGNDQLVLTGDLSASMGDGSDTVTAGDGSSSMNGGTGDDRLDAGGGIDFLVFGGFDNTLVVNLAKERSDSDYWGADKVIGFENVHGTNGNDVLIGDKGDNVLIGDAGTDSLVGGLGDDVLYAYRPDRWHSGDSLNEFDTLIGGKGQDILYAETTSGWHIAQATFVFETLGDSTKKRPDHIVGGGYLIDLSAIDADTSKAGDQAFDYVDDLSGEAGQVAVKSAGSLFVVLLDVDGDAKADAKILVDYDLQAGSFVL